MADGVLGVGNPQAVTDADGRFTITAGPLWEYSENAIVGLVVPRAPDRPFDLGVLAVEDAAGALRLSLSAAKPSIDLGTITLEINRPKT
jgi:hypothetical protein